MVPLTRARLASSREPALERGNPGLQFVDCFAEVESPVFDLRRRSAEVSSQFAEGFSEIPGESASRRADLRYATCGP